MYELSNLLHDEQLENYSPRAPEMNLLLAYLNRAVLDFLGNQSNEREDAKEWLFDDREDSFSYLWTCSHLNLDPEYLRTGVSALQGEAPKRWYLARGKSEDIAA